MPTHDHPTRNHPHRSARAAVGAARHRAPRWGPAQGLVRGTSLEPGQGTRQPRSMTKRSPFCYCKTSPESRSSCHSWSCSGAVAGGQWMPP